MSMSGDEETGQLGREAGRTKRYGAGMTVRKITISVDAELVEQAARAVERGDAESVSGFFAEAAARRLRADRWVATDLERRGPLPEAALEHARRTLLTGELVERRDPDSGAYVRTGAAGAAG
jgi:hypothetical protein